MKDLLEFCKITAQPTTSLTQLVKKILHIFHLVPSKTLMTINPSKLEIDNLTDMCGWQCK